MGGKTGTAEKQVNGGYEKKSLMSSFVGTFPTDKPRYVVLALLDEPKGTERTFNYATGGWVAAPIVSRLITRMASLLGILPRSPEAPEIELEVFKPRLASLNLKTSSSRGRHIAPY